MKNIFFGWIRTIPNIGIKERRALVGFVLFVLVCFAYSHMQVAYMILPPLLVNKVVMSAQLFLFIVAFMLLMLSNWSSRRENRKVWVLWLWMLLFVVFCTVNGFLNNRFDHRANLDIVSQACFVLGLFYFIMIGHRGIVLSKTFSLFLAMFYISVAIMMLTKDIKVVDYFNDGPEKAEDFVRNTTSAAFLFKSSLQCAPFFFLAGCFWRKKLNPITRFFCFFSLVPYLYFLVYLFKFRTGLLVVGLTLLIAAYYAIKSLRFEKFLIIASIAALGVLFFMGKSAMEVRERMENAMEANESKGMVDAIRSERWYEAELMFENLSTSEFIFGKGFNAAFDATEIFGEKGYHWKSIHLGFLSNVMRGGIVFATLYFLVFLIACFRRLDEYEKREGLMVACKGFVIVETVHYIMNPIQVGLFYLGSVAVLYLCLGALWSDYYEGEFSQYRWK